MAKIPFSIDYRPQIESGEYKVELRDGSPVQIIYWEAKGPAPIIGLFMADDGCETTTQAHSNGRWSDDESYESDYDLFIITPAPELTEFEKELESFYNHHLQVCTYDNQGTVEDSLHYWANKLLSLARKQLQPEIDAMLEDAYKTADEVQYRKGRADVLKELPRWKKAAQAFGNYTVAPTETGEYCLLIDGYFIMLSDLMKLPKENEK